MGDAKAYAFVMMHITITRARRGRDIIHDRSVDDRRHIDLLEVKFPGRRKDAFGLEVIV